MDFYRSATGGCSFPSIYYRPATGLHHREKAYILNVFLYYFGQRLFGGLNACNATALRSPHHTAWQQAGPSSRSKIFTLLSSVPYTQPHLSTSSAYEQRTPRAPPLAPLERVSSHRDVLLRRHSEDICVLLVGSHHLVRLHTRALLRLHLAAKQLMQVFEHGHLRSHQYSESQDTVRQGYLLEHKSLMLHGMYCEKCNMTIC